MENEEVGLVCRKIMALLKPFENKNGFSEIRDMQILIDPLSLAEFMADPASRKKGMLQSNRQSGNSIIYIFGIQVITVTEEKRGYGSDFERLISIRYSNDWGRTFYFDDLDNSVIWNEGKVAI